MSEKTIEQIESKLRTTPSLSEDARRDLLGMIATLREEISTLEQTHGEQAESIAGFAGTSAHEALRGTTDSHLLELSLDGLTSSVKELETSHPRLVDAVNSICRMLSDIGV